MEPMSTARLRSGFLGFSRMRSEFPCHHGSSNACLAPFAVRILVFWGQNSCGSTAVAPVRRTPSPAGYRPRARPAAGRTGSRALPRGPERRARAETIVWNRPSRRSPEPTTSALAPSTPRRNASLITTSAASSASKSRPRMGATPSMESRPGVTAAPATRIVSSGRVTACSRGSYPARSVSVAYAGVAPGMERQVAEPGIPGRHRHLRPLFPDADHAGRLAVGQRANQHLVDHRVEAGRRPDTEGEDEHAEGREPPLAAHQP